MSSIIQNELYKTAIERGQNKRFHIVASANFMHNHRKHMKSTRKDIKSQTIQFKLVISILFHNIVFIGVFREYLKTCWK